MKEDFEEKLLFSENYSKEKDIEITPKCSGISYIGVTLTIFSALFYSLSSLIVKLMLKVDPMELLMFRYIGFFLFTLPISIHEKQSLFPEDFQKNIYLWFHSVTGVAGGVASFYAFRHMPLGDASALCFSTPLFVLVISFLCLREEYNIFTWFTVGLTFAGVVLISKPELLFGISTEHPVKTLGVISAVLAAFFKANSFISLKFCKSLHFSVIICHFGLIGLLFSITLSLITNSFCIPSSFLDRLVLIVIAILGFLGQLFLTLASKREKPATMSICRSTDILFAFLYQIYIFNHIPDIFSVIGALFIVISVFLIKLKPRVK